MGVPGPTIQTRHTLCDQRVEELGRAARGPPEVDNLVLELDASYMDSSIDSQDQAEPPELTYIDIDPFVESF